MKVFFNKVIYYNIFEMTAKNKQNESFILKKY